MNTKFVDLSSKHYDPTASEGAIYSWWEEKGVFAAKPDSGKPPYSIVIPPPNVTGRLHMGHALNNSVQDSLIRFKRMDGYDALWIPGTDHAGISTQSVVKKQLDAQGISYLELGREKMVERIWEWKTAYGDQILRQLRRMGCSCDWSRTRFTMDDGLSHAVRAAFKRLYDDGLIYRGKYIVNWCPVDRTALSDDEVITTEGGEPGHLWHITYPLADGSGELVVATTRPETMLGDTAVAVNPKDERYLSLIGKQVRLPLTDRLIPIIADDYVDKEYGTGCLKVTPAHDPNDFQIGLRHNLPQINVMNEDATMGDGAPQRYQGMDRFECRRVVVDELKALGLLVRVEDQMTPVGRAERSKAVIEYRLSDQWFVRMKPLAEAALKAGAEQGLHMVPDRWNAIYRNWLENTRDWCISRQIWWGHQIPAWYNKTTGEILVDAVTPARVQAAPDEWRQDEDVLDTWFSSALWPYSTMGWPENTKDLERYYPTSVLSTAKDIIYFWVARMVMTGVHLLKRIPFQKVYFHAVICDARGETMSKSRGNGIDPLHVIDGAALEDLEGPVKEARPENMQDIIRQIHKLYPDGFKGVGADALRVTLLSLNSEAQQVQLSLDKFEEMGQRFVTKLFNAAKFVLSNLQEVPADSAAAPRLEDRWILARLDAVTARVRQGFDRFLLSDAVAALSDFFWGDLCDWYLEIVKTRLREGGAERKQVQQVLAECLSKVLRLYHPFTPFVTEALWQHLGETLSRSGLGTPSADRITLHDVCATAPYPKDEGRADETAEAQFALLQQAVRTVRNMRATASVEPHVPLSLSVLPGNEATRRVLSEGEEVLKSLGRLKSLVFVDARPEKQAVGVMDSAELFVNLAEHLDIPAELARNDAALSKLEKEIEKLRSRLDNPGFREKAPVAVREAEETNLRVAEEKRAKLLTAIAELRAMQ